MTKAISANLATHVGLSSTTLAFLIKITREDGTVQGFTTHDVDITYDSVTYEAATGYVAGSDIQSSARLNVDNQEFDAFMSSDTIKEVELRNGIYNNADVRIMLINHQSTGDGVIKEARGNLGNVKIGRYAFHAELRRMMQAFIRKYLELFGPVCRADPFDSRCGLTAADYTLLYKVAAVVSQTQIELTPADRGTLVTLDANQVTNPGAETGDLTGWTTGDGAPTASTQHVYAGAYAFRLKSVSGAGYGTLYQDVDLVSGVGLSTADIDAERCLFQLDAFYRAAESGEDGYMWLEYLDGSKVTVEEEQRHDERQTGGSYADWLNPKMEGVIPSGTRYLRIGLYGTRSVSASQVHWDVVTMDISTIPSGQVYTPTLINPGAETGDTTGWTTSAGYDPVSISSSGPRTGAYKFAGLNGDDMLVYQDVDILAAGVPVEDVDTANAGVVLKWFFKIAHVSDECYLYVEFFDASSGSLGDYKTNPLDVFNRRDILTVWYQNGLVTDIPKNARTMRIYMRMKDVVNNANSIDDIECFFYTGAGAAITYQHTTDDFYLYGLCSFADGNNEPLQREVIEHNGPTKRIRLFEAPHYTIAVDDLVNVRRGCDRTLATCRDTYNNINNRRAEDYLPGIAIQDHPDATP